MESPEFTKFPKIPRLSREMIITEKIDGTNAQILITENGQLLAGSRRRWITPADDHYGFAAWVEEHRDELMQLGPGRHFGEWWGQGIQRKYGLDHKRWSLFNITRWCLHGETPKVTPYLDPKLPDHVQDVLPECCGLVPVLYRGRFDTEECQIQLDLLKLEGSVAAPGFMKPEGIVVFHTAANQCFKKTIEKDDEPKGRNRT